MTTDLLLLVVNLLCAFASGLIGIEMVNTPPGDIRWKKWLYRGLFTVFGTGVIVTTVLLAARNERDKQRLERESIATENNLSNQLSKADGKLDAIGQVMGQFLLTAQQKSVVPDAAAKAYQAMALAVIKMAQGNKNSVAVNRELSPIDQKTMVDNLFIPESLGRATVRISSIVGDEEAFRFAQQLGKKIFPAAGWTVVGETTRFSPPANSNPLPTGTTVTSGGGGMSDYHASVVRKALQSVGIAPTPGGYATGTPGAFDPIDHNTAIIQVKVWSHD